MFLDICHMQLVFQPNYQQITRVTKKLATHQEIEVALGCASGQPELGIPAALVTLVKNSAAEVKP